MSWIEEVQLRSIRSLAFATERMAMYTAMINNLTQKLRMVYDEDHRKKINQFLRDSVIVDEDDES